MKPLTREWVTKAEGDFATLQREVRARKNPNYDSACFHAQQCAEKYLKARLCEAGIAFEKIHFLPVLLDQMLDAEPLWEPYRTALTSLTHFAVVFRYPGGTATKEMAKEALRYCSQFRRAARESLGLNS